MLLKRIGYIPDEIDLPDIDELIHQGEKPGPTSLEWLGVKLKQSLEDIKIVILLQRYSNFFWMQKYLESF